MVATSDILYLCLLYSGNGNDSKMAKEDEDKNLNKTLTGWVSLVSYFCCLQAYIICLLFMYCIEGMKRFPKRLRKIRS